MVWEHEGRPLPGRARRPGAAAGPAPVLLEERQVGRRAARCSTTTSRASGSATATTTGATPGSSSATPVTEPSRPAADPAAVVTACPRPAGDRAAPGGARRSGRRRPSPRSGARPPRTKTFRLALPHRLAGTCPASTSIVRLTAPDGYTASRSYSIASAPDGRPELELMVDRLEDGEVSGYLHDVVRGRRRARGPRPVRRLVRVERRDARAAGRRRLGRRAADVDAAAPPRGRAADVPLRLVVSVRTPRGPALRRRVRPRRPPSSTPAARRRAGPGRRPPRSPTTSQPLLSRTRRRTSAARPASPSTRPQLLVDLGQPAGSVRVERYGPTA